MNRTRADQHPWGRPEYAGEDTCVQVFVCTRCGTHRADPDPRHDWQEPAYEGPQDCVMSERCRRCGERRAVHVRHEQLVPTESPVPVRPRRSRPCVVVKACVRCGTNEVEQGRHLWGHWVEVGGSEEVRSCERCGVEDEPLPPPTVECLDCDGTGLSLCPGCDERGLCTVTDLIDGTDEVTGYCGRPVLCVLTVGRARDRGVEWCQTCRGTGTTPLR